MLKHRSDAKRAALPGVMNDESARESRTLRQLMPRRFCRLLSPRRVVLLGGALITAAIVVSHLYAAAVEVPELEHALMPADPSAELNRTFRGVDESVLEPLQHIGKTDQVCAMCTDGLVYVHLGRPPEGDDRVTSRAQAFVVSEELYVQFATAPVFGDAGGPAAGVVSRCLAQLVALGQLGVSQNASIPMVDGRPQLTASVIVDFDSASPHVSVGKRDRCPAFLAEVRPSTVASGTVEMDVAYPRLPSWPLPPPSLGAAPTESTDLPPYFGTVAVRETDVDKDVRPPLSVALTEDRGAVVIRFGEDETSTRPEPFEMRCPAHFFSMMGGRYGRQHNQVQAIVQILPFSAKLNRTYIIPILVAEENLPYLRYDAQKLYGFNALRREGGYCLVTYEEARRMFKVMEAEGTPLTLRRFSYYGDPRACTLREQRKRNLKEWWTDSTDARFNLDAWFEDSRARSPPITLVTDYRADGMIFHEVEPLLTTKYVFPRGGEKKYVRMATMRKAINVMLETLGGDHVTRKKKAKPQVRLALVSGRMAFYTHPSLTEITRAMGLLRPSPAINAEADRIYAKYAPELQWPTAGLKRRADGTLVDTLRTGNFKNVIGIHLRHREGTCSTEAQIIDRTAFAIDPRFQLERALPSWSGSFSTLRNMELDCAISNLRVVELYKQYTRWMRANMTTARSAAADALVPTMYLAYDEQSGSVMEVVGERLKKYWKQQQQQQQGDTETNNETANRSSAVPSAFLSAYDVRIAGDWMTMFEAEKARLARRDKDRGYKSPAEEGRVELMEALYDRSFTEMFAMAFDYFMLTNTGVFRGVTLSSVSTNVMMRRWGRGLPCHGVLAGYMVSFYSSMWP